MMNSVVVTSIPTRHPSNLYKMNGCLFLVFLFNILQALGLTVVAVLLWRMYFITKKWLSDHHLGSDSLFHRGAQFFMNFDPIDMARQDFFYLCLFVSYLVFICILGACTLRYRNRCCIAVYVVFGFPAFVVLGGVAIALASLLDEFSSSAHHVMIYVIFAVGALNLLSPIVALITCCACRDAVDEEEQATDLTIQLVGSPMEVNPSPGNLQQAPYVSTYPRNDVQLYPLQQQPSVTVMPQQTTCERDLYGDTNLTT